MASQIRSLTALTSPLRILRVFLRPHLEVVALEEKGAPVSRLQSRRRHGAGVLRRPLAGVIDLRPRDLEDHRPGPGSLRGPEDGLGGVVRQGANVDGRHRETGDLSPSHRLVKPLDRGGTDARRRPGPADQPAGGRPRLLLGGEYRRPNQIVDPLFPETFFIQNPDVVPIERQHPLHRLLQHIRIIADHGFTSLIAWGRPGFTDRLRFFMIQPPEIPWPFPPRTGFRYRSDSAVPGRPPAGRGSPPCRPWQSPRPAR